MIKIKSGKLDIQTNWTNDLIIIDHYGEDNLRMVLERKEADILQRKLQELIVNMNGKL